MQYLDDVVRELSVNAVRSVSYLFCAAISLFAIRVVYFVFFHPLAKYPGPFLAKITDGWKFIQAWNNDIHPALVRARQTYGPIVRIGPNELLVDSPSDVKQMYGLGSKFQKGPFYSATDFNNTNNGQNLFSTRDPTFHAYLRRIIAPPYNISYLQSLEGACDDNMLLVEKILGKWADNKTTFDMADLVAWYAFDTAATLGFSKRYGFLDNAGDHDNLIAQVTSISHTATCLGGTIPDIGWMFPRPSAQRLFRIVGRLMGKKNYDPTKLFAMSAQLTLERVRTYRAEKDQAGEQTTDMITRMLDIRDPKTGKVLTDADLIGAGINIVAAGGDTTRTTMTAAVYYLYSHPNVLARLRKELRDALDEGRCRFPLSYAEASKLEYLQSCLKETMRVFPATGMPLQRVVPPEGAVIAGERLPSGVWVGMLPRIIHFNPETYGPDASTFRPERWMCSPEERKELEKYFLTFGQGTRICLGRHISILEMSKFIPFLVWNFDLDIANKKDPWLVHESWFRTQRQFMVTARRRKVETES